MSEPKFTKGPWAALEINRGSHPGTIPVVTPEYGISMSRGQCVASVMGRKGEIDANADLISAAPELYAALENLVAWASLEETPRLADLIGAARKALAKARGEE